MSELIKHVGKKLYSTLEQYDVSTGISVGVYKPNDSGDPDYIPPVVSADCPDYYTESDLQTLSWSWDKESSDVVDLSNHLKAADFSPVTTNYTVDWGDGVINNSYTHTYTSDGNFTILIHTKTVAHVYIEGKQVTDIITLPNSIIELRCYVNLLTSIPTLPTSLTYLDCSGNSLTSLPTLPSGLTYLRCYVNQLSSSEINNYLILLDTNGLSSGTCNTTAQTPPAPPTGGGITAKSNLISRSWVVSTD